MDDKTMLDFLEFEIEHMRATKNFMEHIYKLLRLLLVIQFVLTMVVCGVIYYVQVIA